jgi:uncharacterized membrane protein
LPEADGAEPAAPRDFSGLGQLDILPPLIATPVLWFALSAVFFLVRKDWVYVRITVFVLTVLLLSLVTGIG